MTTKSLLRPKEERDSPRKPKKAEPDRLERADFSEYDSGANIGFNDSESADGSGEILEEELRRFCQSRYRKCCLYDNIDSSTDSDGSYVPHALKKLMKKIRTKESSDTRKKSKTRTKNQSRKSSRGKNQERLSKHSANVGSKPKQKYEVAKIIVSTRKLVPSKEETALQKSAANKSSDKDRDLDRRSTPLGGGSGILGLSKSQIPSSMDSRRKSRRSVVELLLDPNIIQKEAERMVAEMHKSARENRVDELEGYLDEVKRAIRTLDKEEGIVDDDDDDFADLSPDLDDEDDEEDPEKMDAQAMRGMLTALAGREAKEDAVATVANIGASWRTVPHDQLNCCLSMDPKMMGVHRQRVKKNYEEFDRVFGPRKQDAKKKQLTEDENEDTFSFHTEEQTPEQPKIEASKDGTTEDEPVNVAELTREQMLEIHDKIGPWVHHHTKKLDKFIQSRKYTPQYLLNHWNGELSDDDSEVDFEKYRSAWTKKLEDQENAAGDGIEESQPPPIQPEERVPTLQENNWFLFPTPMTRSYSTETDEQGWDGQRSRPFSQVAMEGLVKYLKRQQEEEKSRKFLREYPWPPPSRYPPEVKPEPEVKFVGREVPDDEEDENTINPN